MKTIIGRVHTVYRMAQKLLVGELMLGDEVTLMASRGSRVVITYDMVRVYDSKGNEIVSQSFAPSSWEWPCFTCGIRGKVAKSDTYENACDIMRLRGWHVDNVSEMVLCPEHKDQVPEEA
jgi:hypothetical protein